MRGLCYILILFPVFAFAQDVMPKNDPVVKQQGVIKVRKPAVRPYFKCEYYLTLAHVKQVEVLVQAPSGIPGDMERDLVPVFDSTIYGQANTRVFPTKLSNFSKMLVEQTQFSYSFDDTSSVDTMVVEMWINKSGKIRWRNIDTSYGSSMPRLLELELYSVVNGMTEWGRGGGYMTPKKFMRRQKTIGESYYCVLYIIASSKPLTSQQKATGARYAPFDIPLNSPPENEEQRDFLDGNKITREKPEPAIK